MSEYNQGYFAGLFVRFLWLLLLGSAFQFLIMYIFGVNFFTLWILAVIISFFINTSLPVKESYPFIRHILILICQYYVVNYCVMLIIDSINTFFNPDIRWTVLICGSMVFGFISCLGRYGNGLFSRKFEVIGHLLLTAMIVLSFVLYWWEGGAIYLAFRIPLIYFEVKLANLIISISAKRQQKYTERIGH